MTPKTILNIILSNAQQREELRKLNKAIHRRNKRIRGLYRKIVEERTMFLDAIEVIEGDEAPAYIREIAFELGVMEEEKIAAHRPTREHGDHPGRDERSDEATEKPSETTA
jgi:hypothetical protein